MFKSDGVYAFTREKYLLPIQAEKRDQRTEHALWGSRGAIIALTFIFTATDGLVLFNVLDKAIRQNKYIGYVMAVSLALILNFIPLLIAKFTHQAIYGIKRFALIWIILCLFAFTVLFSSTVYLRFMYRDEINQSNSTEVNPNMQVPDGLSEEQKSFAITLLMSVEPLVTSIVNFTLAYIADDELRERLNNLRIRRLELIEISSDLEAALDNMDIESNKLLELDEEQYKIAADIVSKRCEVLKAEARLMLAEYLADPTAISKLSDESIRLTYGGYEEMMTGDEKE